jgi:hypothetical protein
MGFTGVALFRRKVVNASALSMLTLRQEFISPYSQP